MKNLFQYFCFFVITLVMLTTNAKADFLKGLEALGNEDYLTAMKELRPLAENGHVSAQLLIGVMYHISQGPTQDFKEDAKWYDLAAEQGNNEAQFYLGEMYNNGQGVPQDYVEAYKWFNLAAAYGKENAKSQREIVEKKMTKQQIAEGQRLSREWFNEHQ